MVDGRLSREFDILNFGYVESAITLSLVLLSALSALVLKKRRNSKLSLARDWVYRTCSVRTFITLNRHNDRLNKASGPAENSGTEKLCPVMRFRINENLIK
jgi:hypothetical protein